MNIGKHLILTSLIFSCGMHGLFAQEAAVAREETTTTTTTTKTVITERVVKEKPAWQKMKVCVMDFTTIDIEGHNRFLGVNNKPIVVPAQNMLNDEDHKTINGVMQGFVRMIDAWDNTRTNQANREGQEGDNAFTRDKALAIYAKTVEGQPRPIVIGADYLTAYLGRYTDVFACMAQNQLGTTMKKIRQQPDFPQDFMLKVAQATGATHLIYGTLSDIRTRENHFKGYGIETHTINYDMDVIIKVVDLVAKLTVFSNVYTSSYNARRPVSNAQFDKAIYQNLMTSALQQAAEELYELCKPGDEIKIRPTPLPQNN